MEFKKISRSNKMICRSKYTTTSLDTKLNDHLYEYSSLSLHETVHNNEQDIYLKSDDIIYFESLILDRFNVRECNILRSRFIDGLLFEEIGLNLGISRQAVQQLHKKCVNILLNEVRLIG
ncbi:hypothetical protein JCM16418A_16400 [Paenibacillus pini]